MVRTTVIGAGTLGIKIAGYLAYRGHEVRIYDSNSAMLNTVNQRISEDARIFKEDGIMANSQFLGDVYCFSKLEDAIRESLFIFECIPEDLTLKKEIFKLIAQHCNDRAILASNTMRLNVEKIFENIECKERCLGVRFLFPVYYVPEVEITPLRAYTSVETLEKVRQFLEKMGQIAFFRAGNEPIVLNEQQRNSRKEACIKQIMEGKSMSNRFSQNIPNLGGVLTIGGQNSLNLSQTISADNEDMSVNGDRQSLIIRNNECVICMDNQRDCVLHPCHHLCVCIKCGRLLLKRTDSCPICRRPISNAFRIYHS
ncbi:hypothetical protein RDWZM_008922 [Blomia tropicalis]|uniref:RING-type domain-containing protein n=1 Tax=Blomia tropicalis TaxID=40697 RepID=A0A9Q0RKU5_BLOTA|nr:hypothetical protein BLOT_004752 [Blomia tropicalis]KAJ6217765.1 hypothetical protein RDWZM_008922 [Blomia tropicalis]